eukprot:1464697-Amphidinium_carterae.1
MVEDAVLRHVEWGRLVSARFALEHSRPIKETKADKMGMLREHLKTDVPAIAVDTDHKAFEALVRRGVAFEIVGLLSFEIHQELTAFLFGRLRDPPADGEHYASISLGQLHKADVEIFRMLSNEVRGRIGRQPDGFGHAVAGGPQEPAN